MSKVDKLKEVKADLKEIFKALLYIVLGILTGITTLVYKILIHQISSYMIVLGGIGLIVLVLVSLYALKLWNKMQEINEEMENA